MPEPASTGLPAGRERGGPALSERVRPLLREAVVEQYAVFALRFAEEAPGNRELLAPVQMAAGHLSDWLGVDLRAEAQRQASAAPWPQRGQATQICLIPYRASPDGVWAGFLHVQARNDTLLVQLAYARPGEADDDIFRRLRPAVWSPPANDPHFLGQTLCFGGIVADVGSATPWAEEALSLCRDPQVPETGWAPAGLRRLDLDYAWLFDHVQAPDALALFYPDEAGEQAPPSDCLTLHYRNYCCTPTRLPTNSRATKRPSSRN